MQEIIRYGTKIRETEIAKQRKRKNIRNEKQDKRINRKTKKGKGKSGGD